MFFLSPDSKWSTNDSTTLACIRDGFKLKPTVDKSTYSNAARGIIEILQAKNYDYWFLFLQVIEN